MNRVSAGVETAGFPARPAAARVVKLAYLAGVLTAVAIGALLVGLLGLRLGFSTVTGKVWNAVVPPKVVELPEPIRRELIVLDGVVENADNPTNRPAHDTFLVQPDPDLGWRLRPNIRVSGYILQTSTAINIDPPLLYVRSDAAVSPELREYLRSEARVSYTYSIDAEGFRATVPEVRAGRRILGVGVNDEATIPSHLQRMVGDAFRVVNTGVGGYSGEQVVRAATSLLKPGEFESLVYVASQNDFMEADGRSFVAQAGEILEKIGTLRDRFAAEPRGGGGSS